MKKRVCISIILTVFAVVFTNHFWLVRKPLDVTFYALGDNISSIDVQLSKEKSPDFKKFKSRTSGEDISAGSSLEFQFKKPRQPKWLKIVANTASHGGGATLTLSDIRLKDHKYKLNALDKFSAKGADLKISDNQLIITPKEESFELLYNKQLKVRGSIKFDVKILLIIIILTYLAGYKLTSYLADFKIEENKSRIDIIFLTIFFIMLFIPMLKISDDEISKKENRRLAAYKHFIEHNEINFNFGKDFDSWFSDRFLLREEIIPVYNKINLTLRSNLVETPKVDLIKSNGWMFEKYPRSLSNEEFDIIAANLNRFNQFCLKNGIKLYVLIPPAKEIYCSKYYLRYKKAPDYNIGYLLSIAKKKYGLDIIYPEKELREQENGNYVYFKTDHHLTDYGSYIVYKVLMNRMIKDLPYLHITPLTDYRIYRNYLIRYECTRKFDIGGNSLAIGTNNRKYNNTEYVYYDYKYPEKYNIKKYKNDSDNEHFSFSYPYMHINHSGVYKLLLLGDSFQENLTYFLNTNFREIKKYRINATYYNPPKRHYQMEMEPFENVAVLYNPNAIILVWNSGALKEMLNMYPSEEE